MKLKRFTSLLLSVILIVMSLPSIVYAESYFSLEDIAEANGYEYFYYADKESANLRSASYILAFQVNNGVMSYKTVLGDVGTTALKYEPIMKDGNIHISEYDATTKLVKYFPNTPAEKFSNNSVSVEETTDSLPSDWAVNEVNSAKNNGLTTAAVTEDYQSYITRENFCELVVKLYEKVTKKIPSKPANPFNDTSNEDVLKAYNLGIVKGVSSTSFNPYANITRQEICAMLVRTIGVMYPNIDTTDYYKHYFNDSSEISSWAEDPVQFAYDNDIMQGTGNNCISPLGNTTCEQAILLVNRIYENRNVFDKRNKDSEKALETIKTLTFDEDEEVKSISVSYTDGSSTENIKIKEIKKSDLIYSTTGMKGSAVNITSSDNFDEATITFEYNANELGGTNPNDLAIAWYNTDLNRIEVLESNVNTSTNTVSIKTTHFSKYLLVDSKEWYSIWQRGQTIIRETDKNGDNAENFNVQLVVDCSGSMDGNRIATARECTYDFIQKLSPNDRFSVIKFGSNAYTIIPCTEVSSADMDSVKNTVMGMSDGGGTNFDAALTECINTLDFNDREFNNIIVFLSDGESSVSDSILQTLKNNNVRIASVALGSGTNTSMMKKLSDSTNGQYVYAEDSSDLDAIYSAIQGSLIGVDATDTDGDGIPDMIEITGMKNQYGDIIRTDPNKADTDGDGKSDGEEMGSLVENGIPTEVDKKNGITSCVYFEMVSDPVEGNEISNEVILPQTSVVLSATSTIIDENGKIKLSIDIDVTGNVAKNVNLKLSSDSCLSKVWVVDIDSNGNEGYPVESSQVSGDYWENTIKNMGDFNVGYHIEEYDLYCSKTKDGEVCTKSHVINIEISGDNFETTNCRVIPPQKEDDPIVEPKPERKYQYTKEELENKDNYFEIDGDCYCYDEDVEIKCDLKFKTKSTLTCSGDVTIASKALLDMSQGGTLVVKGNFKFDSNESHLGKLNLGTIEIYGNAEFVRNFYATQSNKVILKGYGVHEINMWNKFDLWNTDQYFQDLLVDGAVYQIKFKEKNVKINGSFDFTDWSWLNDLFFGNDLLTTTDSFGKSLSESSSNSVEDRLIKTSVMRALLEYGEETKFPGISSIKFISMDEDEVSYTYKILTEKKNDPNKYYDKVINLYNVSAFGEKIGYQNVVFIQATCNGKTYYFTTPPEYTEEIFECFKKNVTKDALIDAGKDYLLKPYASILASTISSALPSTTNVVQLIDFIVQHEEELGDLMEFLEY